MVVRVNGLMVRIRPEAPCTEVNTKRSRTVDGHRPMPVQRVNHIGECRQGMLRVSEWLH